MSIEKLRKEGKTCEAEKCPNKAEYLVNYGGELGEFCSSHVSIVKNAPDSEGKVCDVRSGNYEKCGVDGCVRPALWSCAGLVVCAEHYGNLDGDD